LSGSEVLWQFLDVDVQLIVCLGLVCTEEVSVEEKSTAVPDLTTAIINVEVLDLVSDSLCLGVVDLDDTVPVW
jgi:hypothetical protein